MDDRTAPSTPGPEDRPGEASVPEWLGGASPASHIAAEAQPDEVRATARLVVDVVHAVAAPGAGGEAARGSVHGPDGDRIRLSPQAIRAAVAVYEHERLTIGGLASGIGVSVGWASRIVEELEAAGYVVRERDADDRRVVWVRLSPDAIADVAGAYRWRDDAVEQALAGLGAGERDAVRRFLTALARALAPEDHAAD